MSLSKYLLGRIARLRDQAVAATTTPAERQQIEQEISLATDQFLAREMELYLANEEDEAEATDAPMTSAEVLAEVLGFVGTGPLPPVFIRQGGFLPGGEYRP